MLYQKILADFFDFDTPCPKEIPMCEQIRLSFQEEIKKLENTPGCSSCAKSRVKSRFVEAIIKELSNQK